MWLAHSSPSLQYDLKNKAVTSEEIDQLCKELNFIAWCVVKLPFFFSLSLLQSPFSPLSSPQVSNVSERKFECRASYGQATSGSVCRWGI